ncbi:MAG TPA: hypothetical protein VKA54_21735, partial [Gemmatimonadaceae bacterium]|nr:hypothetical protein [Gemmatimonadaceae bacterium]
RDLVQRHGGRTGVEPRGRDQRGSRFFVELPRTAGVTPDRAERPAEDATPPVLQSVGAGEGEGEA